MTMGFYYDQSKCSGCRACQAACKDRNNLLTGQVYRHVGTFETGAYPNARMYHYSYTCNHCESPACVAACPTGAMEKAEDGTVQHDDSACIGCESCVKACPYGVPVKFEDSGIVGKCDACRPFTSRGLNPVCVDACDMRALDFGDVEELKAKYGDDLVKDLPILPDSSATAPNTLIKPYERALDEEFEEVLL